MAKKALWVDDELNDDTPVPDSRDMAREPKAPEDQPPEPVTQEKFIYVRRRATPERVQKTMTLQPLHVNALDDVYKKHRTNKTGKSRPDLLEEAIELLCKKHRVEVKYDSHGD
jgi:hypothetical protein